MGWMSWLKRKGLVPSVETTVELKRSGVQRIIQTMVILDNKLQKLSTQMRMARARGNDPEPIRLEIIRTEQHLLTWTRKLELYEEALVEEEKRRVGIGTNARSAA